MTCELDGICVRPFVFGVRAAGALLRRRRQDKSIVRALCVCVCKVHDLRNFPANARVWLGCNVINLYRFKCDRVCVCAIYAHVYISVYMKVSGSCLFGFIYYAASAGERKRVHQM